MSCLIGKIVRQAERYYRTHLVECSGVSDCVAIDAEMAVDRAIREMFYGDFTHLARRHPKLVRRLHSELWPQVLLEPFNRKSSSYRTDELYRKVRYELSMRLQEQIGEAEYEEIQSHRDELARELKVHPDRSPLVPA